MAATFLDLPAASPANPARLTIDFGAPLRPWDGFGLNYVEGAHTRDPLADYEDYGGFSRLDEARRQLAMDWLYGPKDPTRPDDGLRVGLHKIFLNPHHQADLKGPFVGSIEAVRMTRYFLAEAAARVAARGRQLDVVTTYYGIPAWATTTGVFHWRDVHPQRHRELADYMAHWIGYLRREELGTRFAPTIRVRFASLTNEGEAHGRWNADGSPQPGKDYNVYWSGRTIADFMPVLAASLGDLGLSDIGIMPAEPAGWDWHGITREGDPIADTLLADSRARRLIGALGGHSFGSSTEVGGAVVARFRRELDSDLRAWTTSHDWQKGDVAFAEHTRRQIYVIGVNGIITWAATKRPPDWQRYTGRPPNPQCAVLVNEDGSIVRQSGYYFFKQFTWAGQPGTAVAAVDDSAAQGVTAAAFARAGSAHSDAFVVINPQNTAVTLEVELRGTSAGRFRMYRTIEGLPAGEAFGDHGLVSASDGRMRYEAPPMSVTTFIAE